MKQAAIIAAMLLSACICRSSREPAAETLPPPAVVIPGDTVRVGVVPIGDTIQVVPDSVINRDSADRAEFIADSILFRRITRLVNGGYNGFADRWELYQRAKKALK